MRFMAMIKGTKDYEAGSPPNPELMAAMEQLRNEMTALGKEHFLVDERTDQLAKFFEISLEGATNILGTKWDDVATSPSLEQSNELAAAGIVPVTKTERLVASAVAGAKPAYPSKIEGLSLTADGKLLMINDNDFGITGQPTQILIVEGTEIAPR